VQTGAGAIANSLGLAAGDSLAIFGGGGVGLSALLAAKALGAQAVLVVEPNARRSQFGPRTRGYPCDRPEGDAGCSGRDPQSSSAA